MVGCDSKKKVELKNVQLLDSLIFYFKKVDDIKMSQELRLNYNHKALTLLLSKKQDSLYIKNLFTIANNFYNMDDLEAYKKTTSLIVQKSYHINDKINIAKSESYLGDYYRVKSIPDSAYLCYNKAEKIYTELKDKENIGSTHLSKAYLFYYQGDYLRSHAAAFEALTYFLDNKNNDKLYQIYILIGLIFHESKEYESAIDYYNRALKHVQNSTIENKNIYNALLLNNLGLTYSKLDKNKEAISYFEGGLPQKDIYKKRPSLYAMLQDNLAYSQFKLKQYSELPDSFYKALAIRDSLHMIPGIVINKLHLSEYYQDQKDNKKAIQLAKEAYTIAKEKGIDSKDILISLKQLKTLDHSYTARYNVFSDSLRRITPILPDKMVNEALESKDLALQKADLEEHNKNKIIGSAVLLLGMIVIFLIFYRKATRKALKFKEAERLANEKIYDLMLFHEKKLKEEVQQEKKHIAKELEEDVFKLLFVTKNELQEAGKNLQLIRENLIVKKERKSNFIALIKALVVEQQGVPHISYYISETLRWEKISNIIKVNLYQVLETYFYIINTYVRSKNVDFSIVLKKGTIVHLTIQDDAVDFVLDKVLKNQVLLEMQSRIERLGGTFAVKYNDLGIKIEIIIETYNNYSSISRKEIA